MRGHYSFFIVCAVIARFPALAVMRLTDDTKDGIVDGLHVCFTATHVKASSASEKSLITNTKETLACQFQLRPLVLMDGKRGITLKLPVTSKQALIPFGKHVELCFDYSSQVKQIIKSGNAKSLNLIGIGELDTACTPRTKARQTFASFASPPKKLQK